MNADVQLHLKAARNSAADSRLILEKAVAGPGAGEPRQPLYLAGYHLGEAVRLMTAAIGNEPAADAAPTLAELIAMARARAGLSEGGAP